MGGCSMNERDGRGRLRAIALGFRCAVLDVAMVGWVALSLALAGCGGGGNSSTSTTTIAHPSDKTSLVMQIIVR
jgi:hypothetical protein